MQGGPVRPGMPGGPPAPHMMGRMPPGPGGPDSAHKVSRPNKVSTAHSPRLLVGCGTFVGRGAGKEA